MSEIAWGGDIEEGRGGSEINRCLSDGPPLPLCPPGTHDFDALGLRGWTPPSPPLPLLPLCPLTCSCCDSGHAMHLDALGLQVLNLGGGVGW